MRTIIEGTPEDRERLCRLQELVKEELPELLDKPQRLRDAAAEKTFSGSLRKAIQTSELSLMEIVRRADIELLDLNSFMTGDATLPSDAIDRLVGVLGYRFDSVQRSQAS